MELNLLSGLLLLALLCLALLPFYKVNYKFFPAASLVLIFFLIFVTNINIYNL